MLGSRFKITVESASKGFTVLERGIRVYNLFINLLCNVLDILLLGPANGTPKDQPSSTHYING